ncbi:MAG: sodium ion-translocating decarboxylase subunit beta [Clostridiales Family XIII bacterium]|jgi:oxaloacetate decarboxylase beta subunit|nr:sodium ion-translocating decarboxylase subunit beta [Clostridiales Family XIII bacterium]
MDLATLFQGIGSMFSQEPKIVIARIVLMFLGAGMVYLGKKEVLEPLIMIPMGIGMSMVNAGVLVMSPDMAEYTGREFSTLFLESTITTDTAAGISNLTNILQIDFLQPVFTFTFSNGLIACLVFMGIGVISDVGNLMKFPFTSMIIAMFAELGTILTFPLAVNLGNLDIGQAASIAIVGGADGPMVLFASLMLAPDVFVPITVIAYLYLSLCYGGYPFMCRALIPKELRGAVVKVANEVEITSNQKLTFDVLAGTLLCLLFPVAAPLFMSFFLGNAIKESGVFKYMELLESTFLYTATFFLGLLLGVLCEAGTLLNPTILPLLIFGITALFISGCGGILGGYIVYFMNGKHYNPIIGIAGVSCVPSTAKVAQKVAKKANKRCIILNYAMGASICGVITSAILTGLYITIVQQVIADGGL